MQAELVKLETEWLHALQNGDSTTLDSLLDSAFVSSPWNAPDELILRDAYIRAANRAQFRGCELTPVFVELIGNFAIVKCRVGCEYNVRGRKWTVELSMTDIWVHREDGWKALNRGATAHLKDSRKVGANSQQG
jgi:uncharacterized protein DUF4440